MRTYVAVDGGMSDNPVPSSTAAATRRSCPGRWTPPPPHRHRGGQALRVGRRPRPGRRVPADLAVGDVLATPVTGAYGHSMGSNYNKVPRPAVVFARAGDARLVVRRETYDDLLRQDV